MSLFEILGAVFIGPLKLIFEIIFSLAYSMLGKPGLTIVVLSLAMNILVLPLYRRADIIQIEARDTENKLRDVVNHIKKTFTGDERMMILQTYYRQNNYSPLSVLSGSVSLMLEIPFFMAAYQFLAGVGAFTGASFGPIPDLSLPDGMLHIGAATINVLPILMTVINVVSSSLYLKGFPLKTKIQLYGMALLFLILLYNSPSAMVFYWTLNNTFSLLKTLYYRIKNSDKILAVVMGLGGAFLIVYSFSFSGIYRTLLLIGLGLLCQLPWAMPLIRKKIPASTKEPVLNKKLFVMGGLFLSVLVGFLIPSTYIAASPQEYISVTYFYHPIWYVVNTLCISVGLFMVWLGVFYWLATPKGKVFFTRLVWILCGVMIVNYMFFGRRLGILSPNLYYEIGLNFSVLETCLNVGVLLLVIAAMILLIKLFPKKLAPVLLVCVIALTSMGIINTVKINKETKRTRERLILESNGGMPTFNLNKNGKNVVVIMLDRGIGAYIPYIMEEYPEIKEQFDGFTHYSNTVSYGAYTNFATPSLYGGYDYTPIELNKRSDELLVDKHNEALKVVPTLMAENGVDVTVLDPSYAGYQVIPDLSIYDGMEGVTVFRANGKFDDYESQVEAVENRKRNFFLFCLMKTVPVSCQSAIYHQGDYHQVKPYRIQYDTDAYDPLLVSEYNTVRNLTTMTNITDDDGTTYMFYRTNITHEPAILQEPYQTFSSYVDNTAYWDQAVGKYIHADGQTYLLDREYSISHYQINTLTYRLLGQWFDYLRENDVYDNTRIIVVSDHGRDMQVFDEDSGDLRMYNTEIYRPIMLVKDFNAKGYKVSTEFMTNADVPALSMEGIVKDPTNPFTGNPIDTEGKEGIQYIFLSNDWDVGQNNGTQYFAGPWASVSGNVWEKSSWTYFTEDTLYPPPIQKMMENSGTATP